MKNSYFVEIKLNDEGLQPGYNNLYSQHDLAQIDSFYIWFYNKIGKPYAGKLLDVACGEGEFVNVCKKYGLSTYGIDISHVALRNAKNKKQFDTEFSVSSAESLPYKTESFDFVSNIGSLEHFENLKVSVKEMERVLKPEGKAFILVPNTFSLTINIWNVIKKGEISIDDQPLQRYGSRIDWENLLKTGNFEIEKVIKYERPFPKTYKDILYYLIKPKELIRLLVKSFIPLNLSWCFLFICRKTQSDQN